MQPALTPSLERLPIWVGVDASTKRDSTALVAVTFDKKTQMCAPGRSTAFSRRRRVIRSISRRRLSGRSSIGASAYVLRQVLFDPFQMAAVAQRLAKACMPIEEYPQTVPNLTAATQNLFDLIQSAPAGAVPRRRHAAGSQPRCDRGERRGWRLDKLKQAAQDRRGGRVSHGAPRRRARAGEARLRSCSRPACRRRREDKRGDERYRRELGAHIYACTGIWPR